MGSIERDVYYYRYSQIHEISLFYTCVGIVENGFPLAKIFGFEILDIKVIEKNRQWNDCFIISNGFIQLCFVHTTK